MSIIEVNHLTKIIGHERGVFDVSAYVGTRGVLCFLGPNGAGKSTTIRHLMAFQNPKAELL
jgi:ABC-2 type transport system ATP-binding protein